MQKIIDRFVKYIKIDTQSDDENPAFPSTEKQWDLAKILVEDLKEIGMEDVTLDDNCYIMATLPSNVDFKVPTIGFIAHIDTSPDYSGTNVNPQFHPNYDGGDIVLNKEQNIVLSPNYFKDGQLTALYVKILEVKIKQNPSNYLWSHKRWKHKRPINN